MFKSLLINVPFIEALEHIPGYAKFMKDIVIEKRVVSFEGLISSNMVVSLLLDH